MIAHTPTWEYRLLAMAREAFTSPVLVKRINANNNLLDGAYRYCAQITEENSATFYLASNLLPAPERRAVRALYAVCRATDDLVDECQGVDDPEEDFAGWRARLMGSHTAAHDPVPMAWADVQRRYGIPHGFMDQLIDGIARDLTKTRYATFEELAEYCYGVASTVGLMVMHIVGFEGEAALPYAVKLGLALQLTNVLRDVGEDWAAGRLYLPLDELAMFGLSEDDIAAGQVDDRWRAFMRFQIERTRQLYAEAAPGIALLSRQGRFAIASAARLYEAILKDIEAHDYDTFSRRAYVGLGGKLKRLPQIWWNARNVQSI